MEDLDLETQRLSHRHIEDVSVSFDRLHLRLRNGVSVSIPCELLSRNHQFSDERARSQFALTDDLQRIAWPKLGTTLYLDDILEKVLIHPVSGAPIEGSASGSTTWEKGENHSGNAVGHDARPDVAEHAPTADAAGSIAERNRELLPDLLERVERIESHLGIEGKTG